MEGSTIVATAVVICGTALGALDIYLKGDGTVLTAIVGLFGAVLGYVFGRGTTQATTAKTP
jgi:hypothetical protein